MPIGVLADLRTMTDEVTYQIKILHVSPNIISYEQHGLYHEIAREKVFRILTSSGVFTDTGLTPVQNSDLELARDYKADYLDYILVKDFLLYYGHIKAITPKTIIIDQDGVNETLQVSNVLRYRKQGEVVILVDVALPSREFRRLAVLQPKWPHLLEGTLGLGSPINFFPQVAIGLQTNSDRLFFFGARVGASGPLVAAGWHFAQVQIYAAVNLFHWDYWQVGLTLGYLYRASLIPTSINCQYACGYRAQDYVSTDINMHQYNAYVAVNLRFRNVYLEIGWEIWLHRYQTIEQPRLAVQPASEAQQRSLEEALTQPSRSTSGYANYSRLYLAVGYQLSLF